MLVLTRKLQETIRIGDNVTVTVLRVKGNAVRIGIEAPQDISILRGEIPRFEDETADNDADGDSRKSQELLDAEPTIHPAEEAGDEDADSQVLPRLTPRGASMIARVEQCLREMETQEV